MVYSSPSSIRRSSPPAIFSRARVRAAGFTLLEILVVLAIMGLLVGLAVTQVGNIFGGQQEKIARMFVQTSLSTPLMSYKIDMGDFPSTADGVQALLTAPATKAQGWKGPYVDAPNGRPPVDPWNEPYSYRYPGARNKNGYDLWSKGPDKQDNTPDDIGNWLAEAPK